MLPIRQKCPQGSHQSEWLVQHDVMLGLWNFYHWRRTAQKIEHVLADLRRQQDGMLAAKYRDPAARRLQPLCGVANRKALPDGRVELPGEAALHFLERMARHPIHDIEVVAALRRHEAKARHRFRQGG